MTETTPVSLAIPGIAESLQLWVHAENDQVISPRIRADRIWEPYETALTLALLRPGGVFIDVGANLGYFSVLAASAVGATGSVLAFEPDPVNYELLCRSIALNQFGDMVTTVQAGLSDAGGAGQLYLSEDNLGDHQIYASDDNRGAVEITLFAGAQYLTEHWRGEVPGIDLIKIDTQGSEAQVVRGLLPLLLSQAQPPSLMVELTPHSLREAGSSGRELVMLLAQLEQPMWMIDHLDHHLTAVTAPDLAQWCDNWDAVEESRGFVNVLIGEAPAM